MRRSKLADEAVALILLSLFPRGIDILELPPTTALCSVEPLFSGAGL
jgi:hypothetical protein